MAIDHEWCVMGSEWYLRLLDVIVFSLFYYPLARNSDADKFLVTVRILLFRNNMFASSLWL